MIYVSITRSFTLPADQVWSLLSNWGDTQWLTKELTPEVFTSEEGVVRRFHNPGMPPLDETLLSADTESRTLLYKIAQSPLMPLANYNGRVVVKPVDDGCEVEWSCTFSRGGLEVSEAEAKASANIDKLLNCMETFLMQ
ncbi:SRPBCC family protein [Halioxenophilus sp. WMMB6]|uniref:SRPBCC family protein n=1 Tax=Halioxenophilus sp. WMMB6 TaxID=3073815 RepID=UPI00295EA0B9|nr:SRPBCC family protein [Halioxenophilus sp. WMMB6]